MHSILISLFGLGLLILGAEIMIRGSVSLARRFCISPHVIGLTIIAFGTSAPELFVSLKAAWIGSPGIAIGNVVGSNVANILLMIGAVGIVAPMASGGRHLKRDGIALLLATAVFMALAANGTIDRWQGIIMVSVLFGYLFYCYREDKNHNGDNADEDIPDITDSIWKAALLTLMGIAGVLFGARFLVDGAIAVARDYGISESVIGITLVAVGTSLPELATTIVATIRNQGAVALGNIIGSNIFNTVGIMGTVSIVHKLEIPDDILGPDIWIMCGTTVLFVVLALKIKEFNRFISAAFLLSYVSFITLQFYPI